MIQHFCCGLKELLYPQDCLHCQFSLTGDDKIFCKSCSGQIDLLAINTSLSKAHCFEPVGPIKSLEKEILSNPTRDLSKGIAAFLFYQWLNLSWKKPVECRPLKSSLKKVELLNQVLCRELNKYIESHNLEKSEEELYVGWSLGKAMSVEHGLRKVKKLTVLP
jgi:hypothetical protein